MEHHDCPLGAGALDLSGLLVLPTGSDHQGWLVTEHNDVTIPVRERSLDGIATLRRAAQRMQSP